MALMDENGSGGMVMPVSPMLNNGGNGNGLFGGCDGSWLILFILLLMCGGWNNGGFGGFGGNVGELYPWMNQTNQMAEGFQNTNNQMASGFQNTMLQSDLRGLQNSVTSGFGDVALGIAGINQGICQSTGNLTSFRMRSIRRELSECYTRSFTRWSVFSKRAGTGN